MYKDCWNNLQFNSHHCKITCLTEKLTEKEVVWQSAAKDLTKCQNSKGCLWFAFQFMHVCTRTQFI